MSEALAAGATLDEVFVDAEAWADADPGSPLRRSVEAAAAAGTPVWSLSAGVLAKVADTVTPQGLVAVAPRRPVELGALLADPARTGPILVVVDVADPGNAGTLVRTAAAAGAAGVVFAGLRGRPVRAQGRPGRRRLAVRPPRRRGPRHSAPPSMRSGRRADAWSPPWPPGESHPRTWPSPARWRCWSARRPTGCTRRSVAAADDRLTIPLEPGVESLNAAVAGAVVLFEAARQRRTGGPGTDWTPDRPTDSLGDR